MNGLHRRTWCFVWIALGLLSCQQNPEQASVVAEYRTEESGASGAFADEIQQEAPRPEAKKASRRARGAGKLANFKGAPPAGALVLDAALPAADEEDSAAGLSPTRSWFPETFLFLPVVPTDAEGRADVTVTVPDRLTTWRVLALAHDRQGGRAGAVATFDSTLPVYVDPVVPDALIAGDLVEVPVQVVNTTDARLRRALTVSGDGVAGTSKMMALAPDESRVQFVPVRATAPGRLALSFAFEGADQVIKTIAVRPPGKPMHKMRSGALADRVAFDWTLAKNVRPDSIEVGLTVYPGALGLMQSELLSAAERTTAADAAYALKLVRSAKALMLRIGGQVAPDQLRRLRLRASQRLLRMARSPSPEVAMMLAHGAGTDRRNPLLARLADRLAQTVAQLQRPDGTFTAGDGWPLQRVVVATAAGLRSLDAVADDEASRRLLRGARIRAEGAFERYMEAVQDPYSAAAIVAAGGVRGALADRLRARVREGLRDEKGGIRLDVPRGVIGADGERPGDTQAIAMAVVALIDDPASKEVLPKLGDALLRAYRPSVGWGKGATNLIALDAVMALFSEPLPERVTVTLYNGDRKVAEALMAGPTRTERHEVRVRVPKATSAWRIEATPPVPGLGYSVRLDYRVPWPAAPKAGLTLAADVSRSAKIGVPAPVTLMADGPGGAPLRIRYALPAGVQPVQSDLRQLASSSKISDYRVDAQGVTFNVPRRPPGTAAKVTFRVVPTFAGRLQAEASQVTLVGRPASTVDIPPATWSIKR